MRLRNQTVQGVCAVAVLGLIASLAGLTSSAQAVTKPVVQVVVPTPSDFEFDPNADPIADRELSLPAAISKVLNENSAEWEITPSEWFIARASESREGRVVVTLEQRFDGIPVFGPAIILSFSADQALTSVQHQASSRPNSLTPSLSEEEASLAIKAAAFSYWGITDADVDLSSAELIVIQNGLLGVNAPATLAYEATVHQTGALKGLRVRVDAHTGATLTASSIEKGVVQTPSICDANLQAWDNFTKICVPGDPRQIEPPDALPTRITQIVQNISDLYDPMMINYPLDLDGNPATASEPLSFNEMVGNALTGGGPRPVSIVTNFCYNVCPNTWANAFWYSFPSADGNQAGSGADTYFGGMFIGTGFELSDDVIAHEMTHGITSGYVSFDYVGQSGAIDESMSDIFGESVDQLDHVVGENDIEESNWYIAEDADLNGTQYDGPYRSMSDPTEMNDPDRVGSTRFQICTVPTDNNDGCWVHTNSGVPNKLAYLIATGGTFNGYTISPLAQDSDTSIELMNELFFDVLAQKSTPTMTFQQLGRALIASCSELYESNQAFTAAACGNVKKAVFATQVTAVSSAKPIVSKTSVKKGYGFTATSKVRLLTNGYPGATGVKFQFKRKGSSAWATIATKTTNSAGTYRLTVKPKYSGYYRVYVPATATMPSVIGSSQYVSVK